MNCDLVPASRNETGSRFPGCLFHFTRGVSSPGWRPGSQYAPQCCAACQKSWPRLPCLMADCPPRLSCVMREAVEDRHLDTLVIRNMNQALREGSRHRLQEAPDASSQSEKLPGSASAGFSARRVRSSAETGTWVLTIRGPASAKSSSAWPEPTLWPSSASGSVVWRWHLSAP